MEINIKIVYAYKWGYYKLIVKDNNDNDIPFVVGRVYDKEYEAEIAAGIMKAMFDSVEEAKDFNRDLFDFNIRAVLRLIDAPGKW